MALKFEIVVNSNGEPQLKKLGDGVQNTNKKMMGLNETFAKAAGALAGFYAFNKAASFFSGMVAGVGELGHELDKLQTKTGASAEEISGLRYAFKMADVDMDTMSKAFKGLAGSIDGAASGNKKLAKIFEDARVPIKNQDGSLRGVTDVLKDLSVAFNNTGDETRKSAVAQDLFGRAGQNILLVMPELVKNLQDAKATGSIWTQDDIDKASEYADTIKTLNAQWENVKRTIVMDSGLMGVITGWAAGMKDLAQAWASGFKIISDKIGGGGNEVEELTGKISKLKTELAAYEGTKIDFNKNVLASQVFNAKKAELQQLEQQLSGIKYLAANPAAATAPGGKKAPGLGAAAPADKTSPKYDKFIKAAELEDRMLAQKKYYEETSEYIAKKDQEKIDHENQINARIIESNRTTEEQIREEKLRTFEFEQALREQQIMNSFGAIAILAGINKNASKENFLVFQAAASAEAIVASVLAVQKAASGLPFPANLPGIAIETARGLASVAAITSAKPPSFQTNEGEVKTVPGSRNQEVLIRAHGGEKIGRDQGRRSGNVYIQIAGNIIGQEKYVRDIIIPLINKEISRK